MEKMYRVLLANGSEEFCAFCAKQLCQTMLKLSMRQMQLANILRNWPHDAAGKHALISEK